MDEREVESLFSGAPGDVPPPTFDVTDVVRESKRQTLRRRNRVTAGAAAVVVALIGFGAYGLVSGKSDSSGAFSSAAAPAQPGASTARPGGTGEGKDFPAQPSRQGDSGDGKTGPRVEGASGCEVDWELATALAGELPGHLTASDASPGGICTTGSRHAGFPLPDGMISAAVFAPGTAVTLPDQPAGAVTARAGTGSGGTLVLLSVPGTSGQPAPYASDLEKFAYALAPRF